jgi:hypothetical protein
MADETLLLPLIPRPQLATKRCKRCCKTKPLSEFHLRPEQGRRRAECKECYRAAMSARRDPEDNRRRVREWQKNNPEKRAAAHQRTYERSRTNLARWVGRTLATTRSYCKRRSIECSITTADIVAMYGAQNGRCALTGRPLLFGSKGQQRDSISFDRIENGGPYTVGNVRLVTYQANMARGQFSDDDLFSFCEAVIAIRAANE